MGQNHDIFANADLEKTLKFDIEDKKKMNAPPLRKILVNIMIELADPDSIKGNISRILREFALVEDSPKGARHKVETYTDKYGNTLKCIVSTDYGFETPYQDDETLSHD